MSDDVRQELRKIANSTSIGCDIRADEHFQAARRWSKIHRWLALPAAVIAGIAGTAIVADSANSGIALAAGIATLLVAALTSISGVVAPSENASRHKKGFDGFSSLRTQFILFRDVTSRLDRSDEELQSELSDLLKRRDELASAVPETPMWARRRVQQGRRRQREL